MVYLPILENMDNCYTVTDVDDSVSLIILYDWIITALRNYYR